MCLFPENSTSFEYFMHVKMFLILCYPIYFDQGKHSCPVASCKGIMQQSYPFHRIWSMNCVHTQAKSSDFKSQHDAPKKHFLFNWNIFLTDSSWHLSSLCCLPCWVAFKLELWAPLPYCQSEKEMVKKKIFGILEATKCQVEKERNVHIFSLLAGPF